VNRVRTWVELPQSQTGLSAALRRAFAAPVDTCNGQFEDLLRKLD